MASTSSASVPQPITEAEILKAVKSIKWLLRDIRKLTNEEELRVNWTTEAFNQTDDLYKRLLRNANNPQGTAR